MTAVDQLRDRWERTAVCCDDCYDAGKRADVFEVDAATLKALLDVAEAAETVDDECGVTHADLANALDRLKEVTS